MVKLCIILLVALMLPRVFRDWWRFSTAWSAGQDPAHVTAAP